MALSEANSSCTNEVDKPHTFIDDISHSEVLESIPENNSNDDNEIMLYPTLDYINRILLEEDSNAQFTENQEAINLSYIEKSFYDVLKEKYPTNFRQPQLNKIPTTLPFRDQVVPNSTSMVSTHESRVESLVVTEFQKGIDEGLKFLPTINNLGTNLYVSGLSLHPSQKNSKKLPEDKLAEENSHGLVDDSSCSKKNNLELSFPEGRNRKMSKFYSEETIRDEIFDKVLLDHRGDYTRKEVSRVRQLMKHEVNSWSNWNEINDDDNYIDLKPLLIQCSEAVARNNRKLVKELIKEIRQQASPTGNGPQRLACILTDGLEARLAGTGIETYRQLVSRQISTRETLEVYHMYITASPVLRVSYCIANKHICKAAENMSKIHIIDLGIAFGFQWPPLIQALAKRKGGPPKLRITGIDVPLSGFQPAKRIEQTGLRLGEYAKSFGVPFEYRCIASSWESICIDDLKIDDDEVLIVNSMFRFKEVRDEKFDMDCPRNRVLDLIRQLKPKFFILGIFSVFFSPFFTTRFRNTLLHYSKLFDMFDMLVPRNDKRRQLMERQFVAPSIINLVACEGSDWVVRPEKHDQWNRRIARAGFELLPLDRNIVNYCNEMIKRSYHELFFIAEDCGWLLQGWKGNVDRAISMWKPT